MIAINSIILKGYGFSRDAKSNNEPWALAPEGALSLLPRFIMRWLLVVENDIEKRTMNFQPAIAIVNKA